MILSDTTPPPLHPILANIYRPKAVDSDAQTELRSHSVTTIIMVLGCVGGWVGSCMQYVQAFYFGGLGRGVQSGLGRSGEGVSNLTHQGRDRDPVTGIKYN